MIKADPSKVKPNRREQAKTIREETGLKCSWDGYFQEFRVAFKGLTAAKEEVTAYYTADFEDAMGTARNMVKEGAPMD